MNDQREDLYAIRKQSKPHDIAIREGAKALRLGLDNAKMREALEAIADGEGDADGIARQTLVSIRGEAEK